MIGQTKVCDRLRQKIYQPRPVKQKLASVCVSPSESLAKKGNVVIHKVQVMINRDQRMFGLKLGNCLSTLGTVVAAASMKNDIAP